MRRREPGPARSGGNLIGIVGWIFADTLLVLVVVFLATQTGGAVSVAPSSTAAPPPTTTTSTAPPGVDSVFVCFRVTADPALLVAPPSPARDGALEALEDQMTARLAQPDLAGRRAGIVLAFGVAEEPRTGEARAAAFNTDVLPRLGRFAHRDDGGVVASRAFWGGNPQPDKPDGAITVNVYPMIEGSHGPLAAPPPRDC